MHVTSRLHPTLIMLLNHRSFSTGQSYERPVYHSWTRSSSSSVSHKDHTLEPYCVTFYAMLWKNRRGKPNVSLKGFGMLLVTSPYEEIPSLIRSDLTSAIGFSGTATVIGGAT